MVRGMRAGHCHRDGPLLLLWLLLMQYTYEPIAYAILGG